MRLEFKVILATALMLALFSVPTQSAPTFYGWDTPTTRIDHTPYDHTTGGYRFYEQQSDGSASLLADIPAGTNSILIKVLFQTDGTHTAGISAYDSDGLQSSIVWFEPVTIPEQVAFNALSSPSQAYFRQIRAADTGHLKSLIYCVDERNVVVTHVLTNVDGSTETRQGSGGLYVMQIDFNLETLAELQANGPYTPLNELVSVLAGDRTTNYPNTLTDEQISLCNQNLQ